MKKLMIALSAAAMAFGLRAADGFVGGSNFESDTAGTIAASAITASGGAWSTTDEAATLTIATDGVFTDSTKRPAEWSKDTNAQYLNVRTAFGKPLDFALTTAQEIGEGVYFDSLVKFTACDEVPTTVTNSNAKLAVWIQENTDGTATNLYVCAGQYSGAGWVAATYDCGSAPEEGWHRLTIKSIANIYTTGSGSTATPGFVVYIDGTGSTGDPISTSTSTGVDTTKLTANAKTFAELGRLFPSIDQTTVNKGKIASVGFEGQGQIDDVTITTAAPGFAKDFEYFTVAMGEHVTGFSYQIGSGEVVPATAAVQLEYTSGMMVTISDVTCADGYMFNNLTADSGVTVEDSTFTVSAKDKTGTINAKTAGAQVVIGGVTTPYSTVAEALTALNGVQSETTATLKLFNAVANSVIINNANLTLTIDLAGQTITGTAPAIEEKDAAIYVNAGSVTIIDSSDPSTGKVVKGAAAAAIDASEYGTVAAISGGTFDGGIYPEIGLISGGKFSYADNNTDGACSITATFPEGKTLVKDDADNPQYWILGDAPIDIKDAVITLSAETVEYGSTTAPTISSVVVDSKELTVTTDYTVNTITLEGTEAVGTVKTYTLTGTGAYTGTATTNFTVVAKAVTPEISLSSTEAEWTSSMTFPTVTVTGYTETTDYTKAWNPDTIAEPAAGVTNTYTVTVTMTGNYTGSNTATFKVYKSAKVYPADIPEGSKAAYDTWAAKNPGADPTLPATKEAFLLDCAPADLATAKAAFQVASIEYVEGNWVVKVIGKDGETLIADGEKYGNGYITIQSVKATKFPTAGENADFFQATLDYVPANKPE